MGNEQKEFSGEDWVSFLKEEYDSGKRKVPNTNPKTKNNPLFREVAMSTLFKNDSVYREKIKKEFEQWKGSKSESPRPKQTYNLDTFKNVLDTAFGKDRFYGKTYDFKFDKDLPETEFNSLLEDFSVNKEDLYRLVGLSVFNKKDTFYIHESDKKASKRMKSKGIQITMISPDFTTFKRSIFKDTVYNETLETKRKGGGLGAKLFATQVFEAKSLGMKYIKCDAYRSPDKTNTRWVGYKVWPKLGYDGKIPTEVLKKIPTEMKDLLDVLGYEKPYKVSHLYSLPDDEGVKWWEENGDTFDAEFDLSDDSYSMKTLTKYLEKKASQNKKQASILKKDPLLKHLFTKLANSDDPLWDEFVKEKYDGGKKKVPNTDTKTKKRYPEVAFSTLLGKDENFRAQKQREFEQWKGELDPFEQNSKAMSALVSANIKKADTLLESVFSELSKLKKYQNQGKEYPEYLDDIQTFTKKYYTAYTPYIKAEVLRKYAQAFAPVFEEFLSANVSKEEVTKFESHIFSWVDDSNTKNSWQLHNFADRLGFGGDIFFGHNKEIKETAEKEKWADSLDPDLEKPFAIAYAFQQSIFSKLGVKNITLYRGVYLNGNKPLKSKMEVATRPMASTSNNVDIADSFGDHTIEYKVPVKNIFMGPFVSAELSRLGDLGEEEDDSEDEYIVMGLSDFQGKVIRNRGF